MVGEQTPQVRTLNNSPLDANVQLGRDHCRKGERSKRLGLGIFPDVKMKGLVDRRDRPRLDDR